MNEITPITLKELMERYTKSRAHKMQVACQSAINTYGDQALAVTTSGTPTTRNGSNAARRAKLAGFEKYEIFTGSRAGKNKNDGYNLIIVSI